ncbi:hypothetical protein D3C80_1088220 [compost metagenome]
MRATDQLGLAESAHGGEFGIAVGDVAGDVGGGNKPLILAESLFDRGDRHVETHDKTPFAVVCQVVLCSAQTIRPTPRSAFCRGALLKSLSWLTPVETRWLLTCPNDQFYELHHIMQTKVMNCGVVSCG